MLESALPAGRLGNEADRTRFAVDGLTPELVVFPESLDEARAALAATGAAHLAVLPAGLAGHLDIGMPARALDCVVSTARLDRIIDHTAADMTVTVQAGVTVHNLNAVLARAGQWLPVDAPLPSTTTIGGLIAANLNGLLRAAHGGVRDLLIGLAAIRADGTLIRSGGRVVKNVAGYDLHKAFVGSLGTLGLIAEATFKVRPAPPANELVLASCQHVAEAARIVEDVRRTPVEPHWLAVATGSITRATSRGELLVAIGLAGSAAAVAADRDQIAAVMTADGREKPLIVRNDGSGAGPDQEAIYASFRDFPARSDAHVMCTVTVLPGDVWPFVELVTNSYTPDTGMLTKSIDTRFVVEPLVARVHIAIDTDDLQAVVAMVTRLRALAGSVRGHLMIRRASPELKERLGVWGDLDPPVVRLMERLKQTFDPERRLSPGRFVARL